MAIYGDANKAIEKWTSIIHFVCIPVSVYSIMGLVFILNIIAYFTIGLDYRDYDLPAPLWYSEEKKN